MRKKLTLMFVALIAVAAFAATHALNQVRDEATSVADVAALNALDNGTAFTFTGNALVVANVTKGNSRYVYIKDATGSSLIYDSNGNKKDGSSKTADWAVGKTITPEWAGKVSVYNKLFEVVPNAALTVLDTDAEAVAYDEVTLADVTAANMNKVVKLTNVTIASVSGSNFTIKKGDTSVAGYNQFAVTGLANGLVCSEMIGAISVYNDNVQFQPISFTVGTPAPEPADITISPASGDISAALAEATALKTAKNITINLTANGAYTVTAPIVASANVTINGADGATIDASGNTGDFITLNGTTAWAKKSDNTDSDHKLIASVTISGVTISGLKGALVTDAQKTLVETLTIDNSVIEMPATAKNVLNFNGKGYIGKVVVKNSTIWAKGKNTGFFVQYGSRPKNVNGEWLQEFDVQNSTFVNIANGKNFCNLKQYGTAQNVYTIKNNIFVDCGKQNQVVVGFNNGQTSPTPVWDVDGNAFNWNGADVTAAEVEKAGKKNGEDIVKNSVAGDPEFKDAANGDFHVGASTLAAKNRTGDPRWLVDFVPLTVTVADGIENGTVTVDKATAATGETVTVTATPNKPYRLGAITVTDADGNDVTVDGTTFVMPAKDVTVSATFEYNISGDASAAIDVEVPADLGDMTPATAGQITDLYAFLQSYLQDSQNPAYIKLTLKPGAEYTISKPLSVMTAIAIEGDESNPATIDASNLAGAFVQIDGEAVAAEPNDKGFFTGIYDVTFKNFEVTGLSGSLFNANSQKYLIPTFTMENVLVEMTTNLPTAPMLVVEPTDESAAGAAAVIDMTGSVVENLVVTKSTMNGATLAYKATTDAATAGVAAQTIKVSYNTFYKITGLQLGEIEYVVGAPAMSSRIAAPTTDLSIDFNHNVVISKNFYFAGSVMPSVMLVQYNSFLTDDGKDNNSTALKGVPGVGGTVEGDLVFAAPAEVANGNLALGACPQKTAKIGDPRWLNAAMKVTPAAITGAGGDLAAVINQGVKDGFMKFQLEENARYSVKQPIVATTGLVITGENVRIDVDHDDVFIKLASEPTAPYMKKYTAAASAPALNRAPAADETDYYAFNELKLKGLQITGLKNSIIYDNNVKYCVVDLTIDDCVLALETEAVENEALISFKAGGAKDFTIKNSTVYGNNAVAKYFIRYNNSARLDRYGFNKDADFQTMTYQNNTFYGLLKSDGQWGNYNGISGQNYSKFVVEKNIWYNCGKDLIRRMAGGRFGNGAPLTFDKNTYFNDGADISASEASYDKSGTALMSDPSFKKPGDGDFTLSAYAEQCVERTGDPRWFANGGHYNNATAIEGMTTETADDDAPMYNLSGQRVTKSYKGIVIKNGKKVTIK